MNDALWAQIVETHSRYIEAENGDQLEYEKDLEALIRNYLYAVPSHNFKFRFGETAEVLKRSILSNQENYSCFKLVNAWLAIAKYANNLLSQPWRKEFASIKLYSGFYKHQVEPVLLNGKVLLELMGYREAEPGHMALFEPIDGEVVRMMALDAFIAMVECQILKEIYDDVWKKLNGCCSWKEVIEFRELYGGTPEHASKKIITKYHHQRTCRSSTYAPSYAYPHLLPPPHQVAYNGFGATMSSGPMPSCVHSSPAYPVAMSNPNFNGYYFNHSTVPLNYNWNAPPSGGNLIDLDSPYKAPISDSYSRSLTSSDEHPHHGKHRSKEDLRTSWAYVFDKLDKPNGSSYVRKSSNSHSGGGGGGCDNNTNKINEGLKHFRLEDDGDERATSRGESRDVYAHSSKSRESHRPMPPTTSGSYPGNSRTLDRGDQYQHHHRKHDAVDARMHTMRSDARAIDKSEGKTDRHRKEYTSSEWTELSGEKNKSIRSSISPDMKYESFIEPPPSSMRADSNERRVACGSNSRVNTNVEENELKVSGANLRVNLTPEIIQTKSSTNSGGGATTWFCDFCTFKNKTAKDICDMCGKSRNSGVELKPLESGGSQCTKCTLVNEKGAQKCEACGESLENSPTYI